MAFKKEIIALLRKREGVQLSSTRVEQIATVLDAEVVEEADIEDAIKTYDKYNPLAEIAKLDDKIRTLENQPKPKTPAEIEAEKLAKEAEEKAKEKSKLPDDVPEWAKALIESSKATIEKLAKLEGTKVVNDRKSIASDRFKDANEAFKADLLSDLEEINFKDDDHFNTYLERKEKTFGDLQKAEVIDNLGNGKHAQGGKDGEKQKVASAEVVDEIMNGI